MILVVIPLLVTSSIAMYQFIYWSDATEIKAPLRDINVSSARQFRPGDVRRAETTEITVAFADDKGTERTITQLSPLTRYFFSYGDEITIKYFNDTNFEATVWNFTIKFYYIIVFLAYLIVSSLFIGIAELKNR